MFYLIAVRLLKEEKMIRSEGFFFKVKQGTEEHRRKKALSCQRHLQKELQTSQKIKGWRNSALEAGL